MAHPNTPSKKLRGMGRTTAAKAKRKAEIAENKKKKMAKKVNAKLKGRKKK